MAGKGEGAAIGIDLGTTYSCVGVWQHGCVEIITNDQGNRTTPSYVAFTANDCLIGDAARNQVDTNPVNTVFAKVKATGKMSKITITNNKERPSKEDIAKKIEEAEKFKQEDEKHKKKSARINLEKFAFDLRNAIKDDKIAAKLRADDKKKIEIATETAVQWLEFYPLAETDELTHEYIELRGACNPILAGLY